MSKKVLIVIDMQNDFIDGALGTKEAKAIIPNVVKKIDEWDGDILYTMDTHFGDYLETREGRYLPVKHCIELTDGWFLDGNVIKSMRNAERRGVIVSACKKINTFGHKHISDYVGHCQEIEIVGLCTDVCVVTNVLLLRTFLRETEITVDASCCAGTTPEAHQAALTVMKSCHVNIINN